jgi:hypothetical protein
MPTNGNGPLPGAETSEGGYNNSAHETKPRPKNAQAAFSHGYCATCGTHDYLRPLHGKRGGPGCCLSCIDKWDAEWACGCADSLRNFPVLPGIGFLTIVADNDAKGAGQDAARACARSWAARGHEVEVLIPTRSVRTSMTLCGGRHE